MVGAILCNGVAGILYILEYLLEQTAGGACVLTTTLNNMNMDKNNASCNCWNTLNYTVHLHYLEESNTHWEYSAK